MAKHLKVWLAIWAKSSGHKKNEKLGTRMNPIFLMFLAPYFDSVSVLSFTGAVSITLNFHPQGRNVNDAPKEGM